MVNKKNKYFPMFINLTDKNILVVGGGRIAERRIKVLLSFGANISVIALETTDAIRDMYWQKLIQLEKREFMPGDVKDFYLVLAATDSEKINREVYVECKNKEIPVNVSSDSSLCDFYFPAVIEEGEIIIGVSGNGKNHTEVKESAARLRKILKDDQE
jgi:siroheme synthase-like protein